MIWRWLPSFVKPQTQWKSWQHCACVDEHFYGNRVRFLLVEWSSTGGNLALRVIWQCLDLEPDAAVWEGREGRGPLTESELTHFVLLLTGAVSMSCTDPGLWAVKGGNKLVCSRLLQASRSNLVSGLVMSIEEKTRTKQTGKLELLFYCSWFPLQKITAQGEKPVSPALTQFQMMKF